MTRFIFIVGYIILLLGVCLCTYEGSEIEVTFSNEDEEEQSFIMKTDSTRRVGNESLNLHNTSQDSDNIVAKLRIMKGDIMLLEKPTADIGRDGYDIDINSDLLDIGENELDLLLYSMNGTLLQQERMTVVSPTNYQIDNKTIQVDNPENNLPFSVTQGARNFFKKKLKFFNDKISNFALTDEQYGRIVKASCGTIGIATGGAVLYLLRPKENNHIVLKEDPTPMCSGGDQTGNSRYTSAFRRYPILARPLMGEFNSPKAAKLAKQNSFDPTSVRQNDMLSNMKDILLGRPRRPKSYNMLLQGGVALLGAQVARSVISKLSTQKRNNNHGGLFHVGTSRAKKPWCFGRFLPK